MMPRNTRVWLVAAALMGGLLLTASAPAQSAKERPAPRTGWEFKLFQLLAKAEPTGNTVISPFSLETAFALAYSGGQGETKAEIGKVFGFSAKTRSWYGDAGKNVALATGIWVNKDDTQLRRGYVSPPGTEVKAVSFADAKKASGEVNAWISQKTKGKIPQMVTPSSLKNTRALLVSALHFSERWEHEFDPKETVPQRFDSPGGVKKVPMMAMAGKKFPTAYIKSKEVKLLRLPLKGGLSVLFVLPLPDEGYTMGKLLEELTLEQLNSWQDKMTVQEVSIVLPKFELSSGMELEDQFKALGVRTAFVEEKADFSSMLTRPAFIGKVVHKANLKIAEKGAEGSSATALVIKRGHTGFYARTPFLVMVQDASRENFFLGIVNDPSLK